MGFGAVGRLNGRGMGGMRGYYRGGAGVTMANYGDTITYNVPGQPAGQIWLEQYVNGVLGYNGPFSIPMSPYTLSSKDQPGNWISTAYSLVNGQKGDVLERSTLYVLGYAATQPTSQTGQITPTPSSTPAPPVPALPPPSVVNINTAPSIPGALPSGGTVGASYNSGSCLSGKYRFILATGGGFATGASLPGCSQTNSANCDPQFFSTLADAIHYALSRGETPYKVDTSDEPWQLLSCMIAPDPHKVYNSDGSLGGGFSMTTLLILGAIGYTLLRRRS